MVEEVTAKNIVFFGIIVQFIVLLFFPIFILQLPLIIQTLLAFLPAYWVPLMTYLWIIIIIFWIIGWIILYLWIRWYKTASAHKWGLILTGLVALILTGFIAGLLVIIGAILAPKPGMVEKSD